MIESSDVLIGLLVSGQVAALFKDNELCVGDHVSDAPCGERGHVHVISAGDDEGGEVKVRERGS